MRTGCSFWKCVAVAAVGVLCLLATAAVADETVEMSKVALPTWVGASHLPIAHAQNVGNDAWIYTTDIKTSTPQQITGSIRMSVMDASPSDLPNSRDKAYVHAKFRCPAGGPEYYVQFMTIVPVGTMHSHYGGVAMLKPIFGNTGIGPSDAPKTLAYIAAFGTATITKDNQTIATDQPTIALVTQAMHDPSHKWLSESDPLMQEIHLLVPGPLYEGGPSVPGFANGYFYIYWPNVAFEMRNVGGTVEIVEFSETTVPATKVKGSVEEIGAKSLKITLTDTRINKAVANAPAGLYDITISNISPRPRGLYMNGTDICCTEFNRYSRVLQPGKSQTFRFYFAPGKVIFRDLLRCEHGKKTCLIATYGQHWSSIVFE